MNIIKGSGALTEILSWIFLEWRRFLQKRLVGYGISLQQLALLGYFVKHEFLMPNEIADYLHCDRPTASVVIKNLEKKGFIYRKKDERNAKYHKLFISTRGKEFLEFVNSSVPPLEVNPFDVLSSEEKEHLYYLLEKCRNRTKEIIKQNSKENKLNE